MECLEPIRSGADVIARAQTGSGKTVAFGIPIIEKLEQENRSNRKSVTKALVVGMCCV